VRLRERERRLDGQRAGNDEGGAPATRPSVEGMHLSLVEVTEERNRLD
jgi:hypothetical protein